MNNPNNTKPRHRIRFDADPGFEQKVRLLAARWNVKTNIAIQRAVDLANARQFSEDEKTLLKIIATRTEHITQLLIPE